MEKFKMTSEKQLKKMDKGEAYDTIIGEVDDLTRYYFRFAVTRRQDQEEIFDRMKSKKNYARYIKHALKEDSNPFPDGFSFILGEFIQRYGKEAVQDDELGEVCGIYSDVLDKICRGRMKHMAKDLDIPKDIALELAIIYPGEVLSRHNAWVFNRQLSYRLNALQKMCCPDLITVEAAKTTDMKVAESKEATIAKQTPEDVDDLAMSKFDFADKKFIKKLYRGFFGKDEDVLVAVYSNLMLDRYVMRSHYNDNQKRLWDTVTEVMLDGIENLPIKSVKRVIDLYLARRSKDAARGHENDPQRRVTLSQLTFERTPKMTILLNPKEYSKKDLKKLDKKSGKKDKKKDKKKKKH